MRGEKIGTPAPAPVVTSHANTAQDAPPAVAAAAAEAEFAESASLAPAPGEVEEPGASAPAAAHNLVAPEGSADAAAQGDVGETAAEVAPGPAAPPPAPPKPVVAMRRADDRPGGARKAEPAPAGRGGRPGDRRDSRGPGGRPDRAGGFGERGDRGAPRFEDRGPRLGDAAFRAQRDAVEHAQAALRKLAAQAHGEALTQLLGAWEKRDGAGVPSVQEFGRAVSPAMRGAWSQAVSAPPAGSASDALLRLEIAAEVPTPAEHVDARRALQLQLLTKRNDPAPAQTWGQDAAKVLSSGHDAATARRLQNVLKTLLKG